MKNQLDTMLKNWAAGKTKSDAELQSLARRIITEAAGVKHAECQTAISSAPFLGKFGYAGLGAVAGFLLCFFCLHAQPASTCGTERLVARSGLSDREIAKRTHLFGEVQRLFPDNLRWIAESGGEVGVGVESEKEIGDTKTTPVLVKLTAVSRVIGEKTWRPIWDASVVVRGQELVEIQPNKAGNNKLTLWVYPLADGKVAVDSNLALNTPASLNSSSTTVVGQNAPSEILYERKGDTEYKVLETVKVLKI
jgi:hypothetical protein